MAREFLFTHKKLHVADGDAGFIELNANDDLRNRYITVFIKGQGKTGLAAKVHIYAQAGNQSVDLSTMSDLVSDEVGGSGCIVRINFPVYHLKVTAAASGADLDITVNGGNY